MYNLAELKGRELINIMNKLAADITEEFFEKAYIETFYLHTSTVKSVVYCEKNNVIYFTDSPQYVIDYLIDSFNCGKEFFKVYC